LLITQAYNVGMMGWQPKSATLSATLSSLPPKAALLWKQRWEM